MSNGASRDTRSFGGKLVREVARVLHRLLKYQPVGPHQATKATREHAEESVLAYGRPYWTILLRQC